MCFIYLSTWMSDASHFNQTVGDKMQQGNKVLAWQKSGSNIMSDWKDRLILIRQNIAGDRGKIPAPGINSPIAHGQGYCPLKEQAFLLFFISFKNNYSSGCTGSQLQHMEFLLTACRVEPGNPALGMWSPSHWTTREVTTVFPFKTVSFLCQKAS